MLDILYNIFFFALLPIGGVLAVFVWMPKHLWFAPVGVFVIGLVTFSLIAGRIPSPTDETTSIWWVLWMPTQQVLATSLSLSLFFRQKSGRATSTAVLAAGLGLGYIPSLMLGFLPILFIIPVLYFVILLAGTAVYWDKGKGIRHQ